MVKTQRNLISSHLKNRCWTKPVRYKFLCHENVFYYLDFRSYLKADHQKSFHLLWKVLLHSKFIAKSTLKYRLLKRPKPIEIWPKRRHFSVLPGNTKWYVTSLTRWRQGDICKYRWTGRRCRSLTPRAGQALSARRDYKPREARRLWRLTSFAI